MPGFRKLTNLEWKKLGRILTEESGYSPNSSERHAADVYLFRYYHSVGRALSFVRMERLAKQDGVSPATANRRFREWTESGVWFEFWQALGRLSNT